MPNPSFLFSVCVSTGRRRRLLLSPPHPPPNASSQTSIPFPRLFCFHSQSPPSLFFRGAERKEEEDTSFLPIQSHPRFHPSTVRIDSKSAVFFLTRQQCLLSSFFVNPQLANSWPGYLALAPLRGGGREEKGGIFMR